jgi:hypothetical protein
MYINAYIYIHISKGDEREQIRLQYQEIQRQKNLAGLGGNKIIKKGLFDD